MSHKKTEKDREKTPTILVVDDNQENLELLQAYLEDIDCRTVPARDGLQAMEIIADSPPDLILLDVMMPKMSGFEVCRILRKETNVPILVLTAKAEEVDKIVGLEIGADDYMTKPFSMRELLARIRAMLRRAEMAKLETQLKPEPLKIGNLEIDSARHRASLRGRELELSPKEFDLLAFLAQNRELVFSREQLLEKVWGYDYAGDTRTVDVHIRWLRQKIETDPAHPRSLLTVRGAGYKLEG